MFKKLRIKFVAITMVMVAIVMAFAFTVVCVVEYQRSYSVVQTALDNAVEEAVESTNKLKYRQNMNPPNSRDGSSSSSASGESSGQEAPDQGADPNSTGEQSSSDGNAPQGEGDNGEGDGFWRQFDKDGNFRDFANQDSITISDEEMGQTAPPSIGNRPGQQRTSSSLVPVAVYRIDSSGTMRIIPEITTASISSDVLQEAADQALQAEDGFGTFASLGLHFYKTTKDDTTYLAFADTSYTDSWQSLAVNLAWVGLGTLAVFFVVALFYSRWALRPVREAWDSQRQFVADASHDLKTPLTVILANAAILLKHPDHTIASESQWIESTQKEAEQMQGLVNEMLELAQIEAGQQIDAVREPIDLSDLVDGETLLFDSVALERNCLFNCSIDEGITILGDEKQVKKLVSTLIENAFKYVDESGTIDVMMRKSGKAATIDIRNTGSTISPEDLPHIFDRFYRTDKARTSGTGGFGLGLAIAREIARQHGGDITCKSTESEGTTFTITLPIAQ